MTGKSNYNYKIKYSSNRQMNITTSRENRQKIGRTDGEIKLNNKCQSSGRYRYEKNK